MVLLCGKLRIPYFRAEGIDLSITGMCVAHLNTWCCSKSPLVKIADIVAPYMRFNYNIENMM